MGYKLVNAYMYSAIRDINSNVDYTLSCITYLNNGTHYRISSNRSHLRIDVNPI